MNFMILFLKGLLMGMFMLVPGISGGTIAILLNLYDRLLISLSDLFKNFKTNFLFLLTVLFGGIVGMFISSFFLSFVIENLYFEMIYLFLGIVIYYLFETIYKYGKRKITRNLFLVIFGVILGLSINLIPSNIFQTSNKYLNLLLLGIFLASALILPGISVSYVLLIFNIYDNVINAVKNLEIFYLLEIGISLIVGIMIVIKGLSFLLIRKKETIENIISGFVITSLYPILPSLNTKNEILSMLILVILGLLFKIIFNIRKN